MQTVAFGSDTAGLPYAFCAALKPNSITRAPFFLLVSTHSTSTVDLPPRPGVTRALWFKKSDVLQEAAPSNPSLVASLSTYSGNVLQQSAPAFLFFALGSGNPWFTQQVSFSQLSTK